LRQYESRNVTFISDQWPIFWERAEGCNVWDADGNRFLDLTSAFGVASLGHTNPAIGEAVRVQSERLIHAMGDVHPASGKAELCARLSRITFERWDTGRGKVALGNSGFEAVEIALKTSLLHSGKPGVLAFTCGYHGLGFGALTATGLSYFREPFRSQLKEWASFVPYPHCYRCPFGETAGFPLRRA
jgi:4-aminobutyrate aminotransferase-like enzyme